MWRFRLIRRVYVIEGDVSLERYRGTGPDCGEARGLRMVLVKLARTLARTLPRLAAEFLFDDELHLFYRHRDDLSRSECAAQYLDRGIMMDHG